MLDKIWIKEVRLKNFQKHANLEIKFVNGINVIHGKTEAGKSCIRRAIEWVIENKKFSEKTIRKIGSKETSVYILLNNDIAVERVKSASINRYVIHKDGSEIKFDAVNKTIPDEVKAVIGITPIDIDGKEIYLNSALQIGLPFLFDKSPTERMKLFNKLTGNDLLDKLFVDFNKDILGINRDLKETKAIVETQVSALQEKEIEKEKLDAKYKRLKNQVDELEIVQTSYSKLLELLELQTVSKVNLGQVNTLLKLIKLPQNSDIKELTAMIDEISALKSIQDALQATSALTNINVQLKDLSIPEFDFAGLEALIQTLDNLKSIWYTYNENTNQIEMIDVKLKNVIKEIMNSETEFNALLKEAGICPLCGTTLSEGHKEEITHETN